MSTCPCGSENNYNECCEKYVKGQELPATAELLMRSRYTAYTLSEVDYIVETTYPEHREQLSVENIKSWSDNSEWHGLQILSTEAGTADDTEGKVEFIAEFTEKGIPKKHHELSEFKKEDGKWYFYDGQMLKPETYRREDPKVGRNDPCPCGSGKKFKKCCAKK